MKSLAFVLCLLPAAAEAHSWYDPWCCNGGDCGPVVSTGYVSGAVEGPGMSLVPGLAKMVVSTDRATAVVTEKTRFLESKDDRMHACIYWGELRCIYLVPGN